MHDKELHEALTKAVDNRLSGLEGDPWLAQRIMAEEKRKEPEVKRKLSVSLVLAIALMIMTISAAVALMHSTIGDRLFGGAMPEEVEEHLLTPNKTVEEALVRLSMDELLYDGSALHMAFTVTNPTDEPLLYTVDGIRLNDAPVTYDGLSAEGAGDAGYLLGGTVAGTAMPQSVTMYNKAGALHLYDENGKYLGQGELPEGKGTLTLSVAVWRPIHAPRLVDYDDYEGVNVTEKADRLLTDESGYSMLWLMRPENMQVNHGSDESGALAYAKNYKALGWAELVEIDTLSFPVELTVAVPRAAFTRMAVRWNDLTVKLDNLSLTHTGGEIKGRVEGDKAAVEAFLKDGLQAVDVAGQRVLSVGCWMEDYNAETGSMAFTITLSPMTGELPQVVTLAPLLADNPRWNPAERLYDPTLEKPDGVIGSCQFDFSRSVEVPVIIQ